MTFSDSRIVKYVAEHFIPVWESVSSVRTAVFKLGDGKEIKGTVGGEIALSFCRPDGKVYDILPALQSPAVTYRAIKEAQETFGLIAQDERKLRGYHRARLAVLKKDRALSPEIAAEKVGAAHSKLVARLNMSMGTTPVQLPNSPKSPASRPFHVPTATDVMTTSAYSKTLMVTPAETITVVEPGGLWLYKAMIHDELARAPLKTPQEMRQRLFEEILDQPLQGGEHIYDIDDVMPLSLFDH